MSGTPASRHDLAMAATSEITPERRTRHNDQHGYTLAEAEAVAGGRAAAAAAICNGSVGRMRSRSLRVCSTKPLLLLALSTTEWHVQGHVQGAPRAFGRALSLVSAIQAPFTRTQRTQGAPVTATQPLAFVLQ
eukprot:6183099-Pleurochrysis_carterae.AAC.2